ncbi:MAG: CotH kinase family protein [Tannerella sp.]|jgi:hypothetical protein|nr:CotH kinase family protein [Tannerella sp.]
MYIKKRNIIFTFCFLSIFALSCKDETDLSGLEKEIETLKDDLNKLQSVISLQNAFNAQEKIVSATSSTSDISDYWLITFTNNTTIQLPKSIVKSLDLNEDTEEYTIELSDGRILVFNSKEIIYPASIVLLTQQMSYMRGTEIMFEFRVNPSDAIFNYDLASEHCDIALDRIGEVKIRSSYVNTPERYYLEKIEPSTDENGNLKEGQYRAYIRDKARTEGYKDAVALVLTSRDSKGDTVYLSSSVMHLERKKFTELPVVVIRTENEKEILDKENWIKGKMTIDGIGKFDDYNGDISIRGRGNSTWTYSKKPYAIKLDKKGSILGMPKHKRWVLLANYIDRTLIRNHIAFEISRKTELDWTPRGQFVEVMLNDVHLGNYYLCEQIKPDENRVNIKEMKSSDLDEESITGGYLLEFDTFYDEINKFRSKVWDFPVMIKEPDEEVLQPAQFDYIRDYVNTIENLLYEDETFPENRTYTSMIDEVSFIDWWFVVELTGITEPSFPRSCYFHKDRNGPLKAGPVWDFDFDSFTKIEGFCAKGSLWYDGLFEDPVFVSKVRERWTLLKPRFEEIIPTITECAGKLSASEELNTSMWDLRNKNLLNGDENLSHREAYLLMQKNYENRLKWLDSNIQNLD